MKLDELLVAVTLECTRDLSKEEQSLLDDMLTDFIDRRSVDSAAALVAGATWWDKKTFPAALQKAYFDIDEKLDKSVIKEVATEMLDAIGSPDWRYADGSGVSQVNVTAKQLVRWYKALNLSLPEEMPESHLD